MTEIIARPIELDRALAMLTTFESLGRTDDLSGSSKWCRAAAATLGPDSLVPIVFVTEDDVPIGVTILQRVTTTWRSGSPGHSCLRWPFQQFGYHFAPLWAPGTGAHAGWIEAVLAAFDGVHLELRRCAPGVEPPSEEGRTRQSPGPAVWQSNVESFELWTEGLQGEHRRDLGYYERRIERAGGEWYDFEPGDDLVAALSHCFELHRRRIEDKGQLSEYLEPEARRFFTRLAREDESRVRISLLRVDGVVIATCLGFAHGGHYQCFMPGWEPSQRKLDLGRQVIYHQIKNEFWRGLRKIDLLGGDLPYKRKFGLTGHPTVDVVARPTASAKMREGLVNGALRVYRRLAKS